MARVKPAGWISARFTTFARWLALIANYESPRTTRTTRTAAFGGLSIITSPFTARERRNLPGRRAGRKCLSRGLPCDLDLRSFADPNVNRARSAALTYRRQNDHVHIGRRRRENSTCPAFKPDDDFRHILA